MRDVKVGSRDGYSGLADWLLGPECNRLVFAKASQAQLVYQALVRKRTGALARSAKVSVVRGGPKADRWVGRLTVTAPYAASHEFGHDGAREFGRDGKSVRRDGFNELRQTLKHLGG